eukprot:14159667-Heterocapsa_arctica.AAC.1
MLGGGTLRGGVMRVCLSLIAAPSVGAPVVGGICAASDAGAPAVPAVGCGGRLVRVSVVRKG